MTSPPGIGALLGTWRADAATITLLAASAYLYLAGVRRVRHWPAWRTWSFLAGLATIALALLSGLDADDAWLLSVHMVQHLLLMLVAPLLIVSAAPLRLALGALRPPRRQQLARVVRRLHWLVHPAVAWSLYAAVLLSTHFTGLYDLALRNPTVHALEHAGYLVTGLLFFTPLVGADPVPHRPGPLARFAWLTAWMLPMSGIGALLDFSQSVRYSAYLGPARTMHVSALADQHLAGAIMWAGSALIVTPLSLTLVIGALIAEERRQSRREAYAGLAR